MSGNSSHSSTVLPTGKERMGMATVSVSLPLRTRVKKSSSLSMSSVVTLKYSSNLGFFVFRISLVSADSSVFVIPTTTFDEARPLRCPSTILTPTKAGVSEPSRSTDGSSDSGCLMMGSSSGGAGC